MQLQYYLYTEGSGNIMQMEADILKEPENQDICC